MANDFALLKYFTVFHRLGKVLLKKKLCIKVDYYHTVEASIVKLTFYHIRCFLLSKDAFTPNLAEFGPVTRARGTNLALNQSRIEILRVRKKLQNRQKLMTFLIVLNL